MITIVRQKSNEILPCKPEFCLNLALQDAFARSYLLLQEHVFAVLILR